MPSEEFTATIRRAHELLEDAAALVAEAQDLREQAQAKEDEGGELRAQAGVLRERSGPAAFCSSTPTTEQRARGPIPDLRLEKLPPHILEVLRNNTGMASRLAEDGDHAEAQRRLLICIHTAEEAAGTGLPWGAELAARYREALAALNPRDAVSAVEAV